MFSLAFSLGLLRAGVESPQCHTECHMPVGAGRPVPELCCWGLHPLPLAPKIPWRFFALHLCLPFSAPLLHPHVYLSWKNVPLNAFALVLAFPSVSIHLIAHL